MKQFMTVMGRSATKRELAASPESDRVDPHTFGNDGHQRKAQHNPCPAGLFQFPLECLQLLPSLTRTTVTRVAKGQRFHMLTNVNTWHARCAAGVPCGGHAWSLDGLTWSNQTVGAFGPVVRWLNGSYFQGAYMERPQVLQNEDGTPLAFFTGFGMTSYMDSHNFAQLFCTASSAPGTCGPTQLPKAA